MPGVPHKRHGIAASLQHRPIRLVGTLYLTVVALLTMASDASAYLDPGTGSMLLQALIGGGMAAAYFLRRHWQALRSRLRGRSPDADAPRNDAREVR